MSPRRSFIGALPESVLPASPPAPHVLTDDERAFLRGDHDGAVVFPGTPRWERALAIADSLIGRGDIERVAVFSLFGNDEFAHKITPQGRAALMTTTNPFAPIDVASNGTSTGRAFLDYADGTGEFGAFTRKTYPASPFGKAFRTMRVAANCSLRRAADLLNMSASDVSGLENGRKTFADVDDWGRAGELIRSWAARQPKGEIQE